jgi:hypothetical protein
MTLIDFTGRIVSYSETAVMERKYYCEMRRSAIECGWEAVSGAEEAGRKFRGHFGAAGSDALYHPRFASEHVGRIRQ